MGILALLVVLAGCGTAPSRVDDPTGARVPALGTEADELGTAVLSVRGDAGRATARVRVAADPESRRRGLMGVPELPEGVGMLFLFDQPRSGGFWMKDTLVALQIAYLDAAGEVLALEEMTPCRSDPCPTYEPHRQYSAALEMRSGWFTDNGVGVGGRVESEPALPQMLDDVAS